MDPQLRRLVESYAQRADAADGPGLAALFTPGGVLEVFGSAGSQPTGVRTGRDEIAAAIAMLSRYRTTMHVIASATATMHGPDAATGEVRCIAHHISGEPPELQDRVMYIRYADTYVRTGSEWLIGRRQVHVNLVEVRPVREEAT